MLRVVSMSSPALAGATLLLAGLFAGCSKPLGGAENAPAPRSQPAVEAADAGERRVVVDNFRFDPPVLTVPPGTKVTWVNRDDVPHTATSSDSPPKFRSRAIDTDETFSHVFSQPGTYPYFCAVHPKMTATVVVK